MANIVTNVSAARKEFQGEHAKSCRLNKLPSQLKLISALPFGPDHYRTSQIGRCKDFHANQACFRRATKQSHSMVGSSLYRINFNQMTAQLTIQHWCTHHRFDYLWISQKSSDEDRSVACLPDRLKAEIAIHVHLDTLKRVDIFQNTEAGFLCELVLRLKPVLFSPGDYVCRKNEVGHEMYIVSRGTLEVVAEVDEPPDGAKPNRKTTLVVVATLKAGSYFGEISVLNVGLAGNKRTASVRSVGYSDLFCLKRQDLWDVLKNYPAAEQRIRARAEERLSKLDMNPANATSSCETPQAPAIDLMSSRASQPRDGACGAHRRRVCSSSSSTRCQLAACSTRVRHRHERRALPPSCPHSYLAATASRRHLYLAAAEPLPVPAGYWPCASMNQLTCQLDHGCSRITAGPDEQLTTSCRRPSRRQRRQAAAARRCLERDQGKISSRWTRC